MKTNVHLFKTGSRTDVGKVRKHNEDSLIIKPPLYAVADGMGGHEAGEVASDIAIQTIANEAPTSVDPNALRAAVVAANKAIIQGAREGVGRPGMGTTLTAAVIEEDDLLIAQVGDSRAYLLHDGELQQLTRDHSLMEELVSSGQITEEEARYHPNRSIITRALGSDPTAQPDLYELQVSAGDRLLLCSDGLSGMLEPEELERILAGDEDPQKVADKLVDAANAAGGFDNITVLVIDIDTVRPRIEQKRRRHFRIGIISFLLVFLLLTAAACTGLYLYASNSAFLIAEDGQVSVYRGLTGDIAGISLKWHEESTGVALRDLNTTTAKRLEQGVQMDSLDSANELIEQYRQQIDQRKSGDLGVGN